MTSHAIRAKTIRRIEQKAMKLLHDSGLENVCDTAYVLMEDFTPNYSVTILEMSTLAGYQVRVHSTLVSLETIPYRDWGSHDALDEDIQAATYKALRVLMVGMKEQAQNWLDKHPEV